MSDVTQFKEYYYLIQLSDLKECKEFKVVIAANGGLEVKDNSKKWQNRV